MSSPRDDLVYVEHMHMRAVRAIEKTDDVTWERFRQDDDLHDITERCVSVLGEAARKVSAEFRADHPEIPWSEAIGIRHKIVHDYFEVSHTVLWSVVREELPILAERLFVLLEGEAGS